MRPISGELRSMGANMLISLKSPFAARSFRWPKVQGSVTGARISRLLLSVGRASSYFESPHGTAALLESQPFLT